MSTATYRKTAYQMKLDDPRWQKKRLEVLERAGWRCEECDDKTNQLQVHHRYYVSRREPWDYPTYSLKCLCRNCHKLEAVSADDMKPFELVSAWLTDNELMVLDELMLDFFAAYYQEHGKNDGGGAFFLKWLQGRMMEAIK